MVICEVTGEKVPMCETPKYLEEFQNLVFSNSSGYFQDHFDIVSLKFNPKLLKTIFPGTKFSKVTMYRAKCRDCDVMIWSYANTSSALIVHLKKHIQIEDIKKDEKSVNNVSFFVLFLCTVNFLMFIQFQLKHVGKAKEAKNQKSSRKFYDRTIPGIHF